jgi:hypothetical protein
MASPTKVFKVRKKLKARKQGRDRKNRTEREGSTPSWEAVFGEPKNQTSDNIQR